MAAPPLEPDAQLPASPRTRPRLLDLSAAALPAPRTPFVGRAREMATCRSLLENDEVRLLTLTGPGGVGKTRLAMEVAAELAPAFADGSAFVPLSAVTDPAQLGETIYQALGGRASGHDYSSERIVQLLSRSALLLVLDNFEQVVDGAPIVHELLDASPDLKILVTSRVPLHITGEHEFPVPPLDVESDAGATIANGIQISAATSLFVSRARAVRADFNPTSEELAMIETVCQRLDGLPLAIELAASRMTHLSPRALLERIDRQDAGRLPLLTGGPRDLPARQQTMRNAIAWSYDLLDPFERELFEVLSVFVGGFTIESAAAVTGISEEAALAGIASLVTKSLVRFDGDPGDGPRYSMLETIREFGLMRLAASERHATARNRHADWCLDLAIQSGQKIDGPEAEFWLNVFEREHANLRSALAWLRDRGDTGRYLRLAVKLMLFWQDRAYYREGRRWLESAIAMSEDAPPAGRMRAMSGAGTLAWYQTEVAEAVRWHEQALQLARAAGDKEVESLSLSNLGAQATEVGDYDRAVANYEASLAIARESGESGATVLALHNLAHVTALRGETQLAAARFEEALALARDDGITWIQATTLNGLGATLLDLGDLARATTLHREALHLAEQRGNVADIVDGLEGVARIAATTGRMAAAARLFAAARAIRDEIDMPYSSTERAAIEPVMTAIRAATGATTDAEIAGSVLSRTEAIAEAMTMSLDRAAPAAQPRAGHGLTARELEVLRLLAAGQTDREIGASLFISRATASRHVANIYNKLGVDSRVKAVAAAHARELLT